MHEFMLWLGDVVLIAAAVCIFLLAPLVRSLAACFLISTLPTALWSIIRIGTIIRYKEDTPPMLGFVAGPLIAFGYAVVLRVIVKGVKWLWRKVVRRCPEPDAQLSE